MKIKFLISPKGRPEYKKGESYDFNGPIEEGYARKFIDKGWAEPVDKAAERAAKEDADKKAAEEKAKVEQDAKDKADTVARIRAASGQPRTTGL